MKEDIKSMTLPELTTWMSALGEKGFRAKQLYNWMHKNLVSSFDEMTNLSGALKSKLKEQADFVVLTPVDVRISSIDGTRKYLFRLQDGNVIESVLMRYRFGNSVCISTQVGCRMGCRFCASTLDGLVRSLRPSEMLEQIYRIQKDIGERISNVVLMGSGEPFDNTENVFRFLDLISCEEGLNISQRNLTISTCGLIPGIEQLTARHSQVTLALSLHAPNDTVRKELMPIANKYHLKAVYLFGSYARGTATESSDIDLLIDTSGTELKSLFALGALYCDLENALHKPIDLITVSSLEQKTQMQGDLQFRETINQERVSIFDAA